MTILVMKFCVRTKFSMKELLTLKTLLISVYVSILKNIIAKIYSVIEIFCLQLSYITLYHHCSYLFICQISLSIIFHIYAYIINVHININTLLPIIHKPFRNLYFGFGVYIPDFIVHCFRHGKDVITIQRRTNIIQSLFFQWKFFFII